MTILEEIRAEAGRPLPELAEKYHADGRRCAALFCGFIPPEIVHAAGAVPMRLRATGHSGTDAGSTYFAQTHCSLVRHAFDMAMRGRFAGFDAVMFSTGCDHSRRVYDAWRHADAAPALRMLIPVSSDSTPAAVVALERELEKMIFTLREEWKVELDDGAIGGAIRQYNKQRALLEQIGRARIADDSRLSGADVLALHQVISSVPVDQGNALLERLLAELPGMPARENATGTRLFLVSSHFEDLRRMATIEEFGGLVVGDLMCTGTGYFHGPVDEAAPPLTALAERALHRLSCPHAADEIDRRVRFIVDSVREGRCDAVILDRLSFCAIGAAEFFVLARRLKAEGIAVLELEGELHGGGEGQLRTRLEAFREQLSNRDSAR